MQRPPAFSAIKIQGKRAYDLARAGQTIELAPRLVRIDRIAVIDYTWPHLELEIDCGGGTYIRSIARDIGDALGCGGYVETLVRTRTGPFTLEQAIDPAALSAESVHALLRPALDAVPTCRGWSSTPVRSRRSPRASGCRLETCRVSSTSSAGQVALLDSEGTLIALGELDLEQGWLQPRKVLV